MVSEPEPEPESDSAERPARTSVWLVGKPAARGRRSERAEPPAAAADAGRPAALDHARITAVSVRLLDTEGPAKFSMRRLAAELGVTAMSLYWYVDTKDDLLELALDSVFAEVRPQSAEPQSAEPRDSPWRAGCANWPSATVPCWSGTPGSPRSSAST